jgi:hypothetical protein
MEGRHAYLGIAGLGVEVLAAVSQMLFPAQTYIAGLLALFGFALILWGGIGYLQGTAVGKSVWIPTWTSDKPFWKWNWFPYSRLIPITEVADLAHNKTAGTYFSWMATQWQGDNEPDPTYWYATILIDQTGFPVYGRRYKSPNMERLTRNTLAGLPIHSDNTMRDEYVMDGKIRYTDVSVRGKDIKSRIAEIIEADK